MGTNIPNCLKIIVERLARLLIFKNQRLNPSGLPSQVGMASSLSLVSNCGSGGGLAVEEFTSSELDAKGLFHGLPCKGKFLGPPRGPLPPPPSSLSSPSESPGSPPPRGRVR